MTNFVDSFGQVTAIIGAQWGDEGKGKIVDILSQEYDLIVRGNGGANAGHTIYLPNPHDPENPQKFVFHLIPSGILHENKVCIIGNGCVVHLPSLFKEIKNLQANNINIAERLLISDRAHIVFDYHKIVDGLREEARGDAKVGTTKSGIGPTYADKMSRCGLRIGDLRDFPTFSKKLTQRLQNLQSQYDFEYNLETEIAKYQEFAQTITPFIADTSHYINQAHQQNQKILLEAGQGTMLDIDHGTYPFVTSSNASIGGLITGSGLSPMKLKSIIGIVKAYTTRVGAGLFLTELTDETGNKIQTIGGEFGATTERPRRCGWFDAAVVKYATTINGFTHINLTKLDVLNDFATIKVCTHYTINGQKLETFPSDLKILESAMPEYIELPGWQSDISNCKTFAELPANAQNYVHKIEELIGCPINSIGVGIRRDQMIFR